MTRLHLRLADSKSGLAAWTAAASRLGVDVVPRIDGPHVLPLTNASAQHLSRAPDVHFMSPEAFDISCDTMLRPLHFPSLPAAQDPSQIPGPLFIKPRLNLAKSASPIAYTRWPSSHELGCSNLANDGEASLGGLVACPDMGDPVAVREIDFAVNADGDVFVMRVFSHSFTAHNRPGDMIAGEEAPAPLISSIEAFCKSHGVRGGIFNIQAVERFGQWVVMDWNARPSGAHHVLAGIPGVVDAGLAHMLGAQAPAADPVHVEIRSFWHAPIPNSSAHLVVQAGLIASWVWETKFIGRVYGVGASPEDVAAKFTRLQQLLNRP